MRFKRVVVIGLDGLEPTLIDELMGKGQLPNLQRLAGGLPTRRLATTYPAQTPVAWSTFATGVNPGGHGVFDFIRREPGTYLPTAALNRFEQKNRFLPPRAVNLRRGKTIWEMLTAAGLPSTILRCPCTFPPDSLKGKMLSGMGVPDLMGGFGNATFYSTEPRKAGESETVQALKLDNGVYRSAILGPRHPRTRDRIAVPFQLRLQENAALLLDGTNQVLPLQERQWSPWLPLKFSVGPLQSVRGMIRALLIRQTPTPELYLSPVNFDPSAPLYPISHPANYARDLAAELGPFYTTGMVEDHSGLNNGRFDEALFLDQCEQVFVEREKMLFHELGQLKAGLLFCLFDTPDRLQHMFWRFRDPLHPANIHGLETEFCDAIAAMYRRCDQIIGRVSRELDDQTLLIVLSDHGFGSFVRGVNLNTWLYEQGLLKLLPGIKPGVDSLHSFEGLDWKQTKAYSLGLGSIYLNKRGREPEGIVAAAEEADIAERIASSLGGLADPARGCRGVRRVVRSSDIYRGPYVDEAPDLLALFEPGYRASWATSLGGLTAEVFEDNVKRWSGDHIIDPELIPGALFANRPLNVRPAQMTDLAPTVLTALGIPVPAHLEGGSLLE